MHANLAEKGRTGPTFSRGAVVDTRGHAHEVDAKLQEGAHPGGRPVHAEGLGSSGGAVESCTIGALRAGRQESAAPAVPKQPSAGSDAGLAGVMSTLASTVTKFVCAMAEERSASTIKWDRKRPVIKANESLTTELAQLEDTYADLSCKT